jgi:uncharacterized membrane protein
MEILIAAVLVWSFVHFIPAAMPSLRARLVAALGEGPYKGLFALVILGSVGLMVWGWRSSAPVSVYAPPAWGRIAANLLMVAAVYLLAASSMRTNVKRVLRHPQLTGLTLWSIAHLLANGDQRSVALFGALGLWAVSMMVLLNRRDSAWQRPEPLPASGEWKPVLAGAVVYALFFSLHPIAIGVSARAW